ncbi:MAG: hypothetical protein H6510_14775 [Acidobacteria bacterium]|nr:hypothetical protein [Acidobacteriota bacterium]
MLFTFFSYVWIWQPILTENRALDLTPGYATAPAIQPAYNQDWTLELEMVMDQFGAVIDDQASTAGDGFMVYVNASRLIYLVFNGTSGNQFFTLSATQLEFGQHYHIALSYVYDSGTGLGNTFLYVNGIEYPALTNVDYRPNQIGTLYFGREDHANTSIFHGRIDNVHFTQERLYNGDFEPSFNPPVANGNSLFLATFNSDNPGDATYQDESGNGNTLTAQGSEIVQVDTLELNDGFARFNGFSSYLTRSSMPLTPGTDATVELDMRYLPRNLSASTMTLVDMLEPDSAGQGGFALQLNTTTQNLEVWTKANGLAASLHVVPFVIDPNQWYRLALCLERTTGTDANLHVYIDGQRYLATLVTYEQPASSLLTLGANRALDQFFSGHLDRIRISKIARYNTPNYNFYPGNFEDDPDTKAIWPLYSDVVNPTDFPDIANGFTITAFDVEAALTQVNPFWANPDLTPSPYIYVTPLFNFTGQWTIEFWYKRLTNNPGVFFDVLDGTPQGYECSVTTSHDLVMQVDNTFFTLGTLIPDEWNHVVIQQRIVSPGPPNVRLRAIINGNAQSQTATFTRPSISTSHLVFADNDLGTQPLPGFIHSMRFSSTVRYSGDLAVPRSPLGIDEKTIALWRIDEATGQILQDSGPDQHDFVLCDGAVTFTGQPQNKTTCVGEDVTFSVSILDQHATFQWQKDGVDISGATQNQLLLTSVDFSDEGVYACRISIGCDEAYSNNATLTLSNNFAFQTWPNSQAACLGDDLVLEVTVAQVFKSGTYLLQWEKDGVLLTGETNEILMLTNVQPSDAGDYRCRLQSAIGCSYQYTPYFQVNLLGPTANAGPDRVLCLPGESLNLNGSIDCSDGMGSITWSGPGSILNGNTLTPQVTPPASVGDYFYTLNFDNVTSDQVQVQVRDFGFAFNNGHVDIEDVWAVGSEWLIGGTPFYDTYPSGGDGQIDIRDMISLMQCNSYLPILPR